MFYESVTTQIRYSFTNVRRDRLDSAGITRILASFNYDLQVYIAKYCTKVGNESVKNTPKACTNRVRIKGNSWLFLTIREMFSLKIRYKNHLPLFGHYFKKLFIVALLLYLLYIKLLIVPQRLFRKTEVEVTNTFNSY